MHSRQILPVQVGLVTSGYPILITGNTKAPGSLRSFLQITQPDNFIVPVSEIERRVFFKAFVKL